MTYTTTITSKGQITLPAAFRHKMKITPGQRITLNMKGDALVISAPVDVNALLQETAQHLAHKKFRPLSDEELDAAINNAAAESAVGRHLRSSE